MTHFYQMVLWMKLLEYWQNDDMQLFQNNIPFMLNPPNNAFNPLHDVDRAVPKHGSIFQDLPSHLNRPRDTPTFHTFRNYETYQGP